MVDGTVFRNISGFGRAGVQIIGMQHLDRAIQGLINANRQNNHVLRLIGLKMQTMVRSNFEREENLDGSKWPPLSPWTLSERNAAPGEDVEKLRDTGRLYNSITFKVEGNAVYCGTNVQYGPKHQFGDPENNIPVREFLYIRNSDVDELTRFLTNELIVSALTGY